MAILDHILHRRGQFRERIGVADFSSKADPTEKAGPTA